MIKLIIHISFIIQIILLVDSISFKINNFFLMEIAGDISVKSNLYFIGMLMFYIMS